MTPSPGVAAHRAAEARVLSRARRVTALLFGSPAERPFAIRYWNALVEAGSAQQFTLALRSPGALRRMCTPPSELALGEAFVRGDFEVEGDLESAVAVGDTVAERLVSLAALVRVTRTAALLPRDDAPSVDGRLPDRHGARHSPPRDTAAVRAHYDVGNEFYAQWLDRSMTYSCAYFMREDDELETAQEQKLDLICRKLQIQPGERFLDIGCGWGSLVRRAAACYGADAYGITLSEQQAEWAHDAHIAVADYRAEQPAAPFDKIATVGMIEHVGQANLGVLFRRIYDLLQPGGLALIHGITTEPTPSRGRRLWRRGSFIDRYIFPDGELTPLSTRIAAAEAAGFEVRHVESLREHYVLTLRHWVRRLERARATAQALVGPATYRAWRLYMAGSAHAFATGRLSVSQLLCRRLA
jgi:cyclopropane-fatty-acyl-phospholipid synthase